jgi:hypothetical protein
VLPLADTSVPENLLCRRLSKGREPQWVRIGLWLTQVNIPSNADVLTKAVNQGATVQKPFPGTGFSGDVLPQWHLNGVARTAVM